MDGKFIRIAITKPEFIAGESQQIEQLLDHGFDFVHIRKPDASLRDVKNLIENIPYRLRKRLKLHGHFELLNEFNLGGAHLNSRCPVAPPAASHLSRSCHSLQEVEKAEGMDYLFLSPIFDSISKTGYKSAFNLDEIKGKIAGKNVIALGGVTEDKIPLLRNAGFIGAAMLGAAWQ